MKIKDELVKQVQDGTPMECDPRNTSPEQFAEVTEAILSMDFSPFPLARFYRIENGKWHGYMHNSTNMTPIPLHKFFEEETEEKVGWQLIGLGTSSSEPVDKVEGVNWENSKARAIVLWQYAQQMSKEDFTEWFLSDKGNSL